MVATTGNWNVAVTTSAGVLESVAVRTTARVAWAALGDPVIARVPALKLKPLGKFVMA